MTKEVCACIGGNTLNNINPVGEHNVKHLIILILTENTPLRFNLFSRTKNIKRVDVGWMLWSIDIKHKVPFSYLKPDIPKSVYIGAGEIQKMVLPCCKEQWPEFTHSWVHSTQYVCTFKFSIHSLPKPTSQK